METVIEESEVAGALSSILNDVSARGDRYLIQAQGEPIAAVVPMPLYERWQREGSFDDLMRRATTSNLSPEEADALAEEAVAAVRREKAGREGQRG